MKSLGSVWSIGHPCALVKWLESSLDQLESLYSWINMLQWGSDISVTRLWNFLAFSLSSWQWSVLMVFRTVCSLQECGIMRVEYVSCPLVLVEYDRHLHAGVLLWERMQTEQFVYFTSGWRYILVIKCFEVSDAHSLFIHRNYWPIRWVVNREIGAKFGVLGSTQSSLQSVKYCNGYWYWCLV